jgi:hypothetical protein
MLPFHLEACVLPVPVHFAREFKAFLLSFASTGQSLHAPCSVATWPSLIKPENTAQAR